MTPLTAALVPFVGSMSTAIVMGRCLFAGGVVIVSTSSIEYVVFIVPQTAARDVLGFASAVYRLKDAKDFRT